MTPLRSWPAITAAVAVGLGLSASACAEGVADDAPASDTSPAGATDAGAGAKVSGDAGAATEAGAPADGGGDASSTSADASQDGATDGATGTDGGVVTPPVTPPTVDGTITSGEYGVHANGQNQQASVASDPTSTTWYATWTETHLHIGVTAANVAEGVVLYVDHSPLGPGAGGTSADGSLVGNAYDNTRPGALPFRADFVAYVKAGYHEHRTANGAGGWSAATAGALTVQTSGATREIAIPWSTIRPGGRPSSFAWLGYATSAGGYVYGNVPAGNPGGNVGQNATFGSYFKVTDATPGTGSKPFAMKLGI